MKLLRTLTILALSLAAFGAQAGDDSLYRQFGGQEGITRITDDVVDRAVADPRIGHYFADTKLKRLKEQLASQVCAVVGGPCKYEGDTMLESHKGHNIQHADFNALVELLQDAMDRAGVPFGAQNQLLAKLAPMHRDIIGK